MNEKDEFRILMRDGRQLYRYAKIDSLDQGNGLLIYDYASGEKTSRHSDGRTFRRIGGAGVHNDPTTGVPFSQISREIVREVGIPSNVSHSLKPHVGSPGPADFEFSSTALRASNATFAAEVVDDALLDETLGEWRAHAGTVSAQTCRSNTLGKNIILTVLHDAQD